MHAESYALMSDMLDRCKMATAHVLDVGAMDINGTFRPLVAGRKWKYIGLDLENGPNVDVVAPSPYKFPFPDGHFDIVISGSTMEHVQAIWLWVPELVRVLRPGGYLAIHTHWQFAEHRYPLDCWRILPDGMRYLFDMSGQLERYGIRIANHMDIVGTAWKKT